MLNFYFSPKEKTTAFYLSTFKSEKVLCATAYLNKVWK